MEGDHFDAPGKDGRVILKWPVKKRDGALTGLILLRTVTGGGSCKCGHEPSISIKCAEFLDYQKTSYFLTDDSAP
jgi:hypothetical protein